MTVNCILHFRGHTVRFCPQTQKRFVNFGKYGCFYLEAIEVSSQDAKSLRIVLGLEILSTNNRGSHTRFRPTFKVAKYLSPSPSVEQKV